MESPAVGVFTWTVKVPARPPETPNFRYVFVMLRILSWYILPVLLLRKTLTTDASVPKLFPFIYKTLLVPGLALMGVSEMMEGAPDGAT